MKSPWLLYLSYTDSNGFTIKYILSSFFTLTINGSVFNYFHWLKNLKLAISGAIISYFYVLITTDKSSSF